MTGEGGVPEGRKWQAVELVRPLDSNGNVMSVGDMIGHGDIVGQIEYFVACPVIRDGCGGQTVVPNALDWDIVPRDSWKKLQEDAAKRVCEYAGAQKSIVDDDRYSCIDCPYDEPGLHTDAGCNERMRLDLVRRAKALAAVE